MQAQEPSSKRVCAKHRDNALKSLDAIQMARVHPLSMQTSLLAVARWAAPQSSEPKFSIWLVHHKRPEGAEDEDPGEPDNVLCVYGRPVTARQIASLLQPDPRDNEPCALYEHVYACASAAGYSFPGPVDEAREANLHNIEVNYALYIVDHTTCMAKSPVAYSNTSYDVAQLCKWLRDNDGKFYSMGQGTRDMMHCYSGFVEDLEDVFEYEILERRIEYGCGEYNDVYNNDE